VQYATMVDLIEKARLAGVRETEGVRQDLREITDEEEETLRRAFEQGFCICVHDEE
jgi:predicted DNA binding protein